jgi:DNA-binding transcriptional LysR family regulator
MTKALDIDAVKAFVLVAELRSFTRAAEALDTAQAAVSLKIKRLETMLGHRLFERTPRLVRLSADGGAFLAPARTLVAAHETALEAFGVKRHRLIVGISHHVVGAELPALLRHMHEFEPGLVLEVRIETSHLLLEAFDRGEIDAAILLGHDGRRQDGEVILAESFGWIAAAGFDQRPGEPLRLATQSETCGVRHMALAVLDEAGIPWTEVFVGGGITTLGAAVSAGFAIAALARRVAPAGTIDVGPRLGLPPLPSRDVVLYSAGSDRAAAGALRTLAAGIRATAAV